MVLNKVVLIGAGNVATHLGKALLKTGYNVLQVYSRTVASASVLAEKLKTSSVISLEEVRCDADLYIVALKDAALQELIPQIVKGREEALFVHTAGSIPMQIWKGHALRYGVLYPMQTFSKQREVNWPEVPFFIEAANKKDLEILKELAGQWSEKVYEATSEQRKYLHIAAVFACNFSNHMYALCNHLLSQHGIPFEVMLPLIDETARKVHEITPKAAQTGPAIRYDENVINRHLDMLRAEPTIQELYEKISKSIYNHDKL